VDRPRTDEVDAGEALNRGQRGQLVLARLDPADGQDVRFLDAEAPESGGVLRRVAEEQRNRRRGDERRGVANESYAIAARS